MSDAPDLVEEVVGYRYWVVRERWRRVELYSAQNNMLWEPDDWTRAECGRCGDPPAEGYGHTCGIHAALDRKHLHRIGYMDDDAIVYGEVGLAGKVVPGSLGWRAARARVRALWVPHNLWEIVRPLRDTYGVPVYLTNPFERTT